MTGHDDDQTITMTREELQTMLTAAAQEGARRALAEIGLADPEAGTDIRDVRDFIRVFNTVKLTALKSIVRSVTNFLFLALLIGVAVKMGLKVGGG